MGGGSHDVAMGERVRRLPCRDEARDVGHIRHQVGAHFVRDLLATIGWGALDG